MKTLYLSDLDGTLLRRDDTLSAYTVKTINALVAQGLLFSYATARSLSSAREVTAGLCLRLPVIVYNGVMLRSPQTGEILSSVRFSQLETAQIAHALTRRGLFPLVYAFVGGCESVSWLAGHENEGMRRYLSLRQGDKRLRPVKTRPELFAGDVFYFTCIGEKDDLLPVYEQYGADGRFRCTLQQELYRPEFWCELMPGEATKANAARRLKALLGCDRIVSFGDAVNDIPLFEASEECYAVENAVGALKNAATGIIAANTEDGVARYLIKNGRVS